MSGPAAASLGCPSTRTSRARRRPAKRSRSALGKATSSSRWVSRSAAIARSTASRPGTVSSTRTPRRSPGVGSRRTSPRSASRSIRLVIVPLVTRVCVMRAPGESRYGLPQRRRAERTSNSQVSSSDTPNEVRRARSSSRANRLTRENTPIGATSRSGRSRPQAATIRSTSSCPTTGSGRVAMRRDYSTSRFLSQLSGLAVRGPGELRTAFETAQAVPGEVDEMRGDVGLLRTARVEPVLTGQRDHADQHRGIDRGHLRVQATPGELVREQVLDLGRDVADEAREGAGRLRDGGVAHQDPEPVGGGLDVAEQRERCALEQNLRVPTGGEGVGQRCRERLDLAIDHHRIDAFLAAEVLVHHRLGDPGPCGDLLDARAVEALLGEQPTADVQELLAALLAGHAGPRHALALGGHPPIVPVGTPVAQATATPWQTEPVTDRSRGPSQVTVSYTHLR